MPMMTESKKIFLDTNVLIYQTFEDFDREKHEIVCRVLEELSENNYKIYISSQILREFFSISTNNKFFEKPLEVEEALSKIEEFCNNFEVVYDSDLSITKLKQIVSKYRIRKKNVHDANIVAAMMANQIDEIFTLNTRDFSQYEEIGLYKIKKDTSEQDLSPHPGTEPELS
jgi:predicted nucleic acid-binding protein